MLSTVEVATNLYHTSYNGVPHIGKGIPADKVAPATFPAVFVHVTPGTRVIAPLQSSSLNSFHDTMLLRVVVTTDSFCDTVASVAAPACIL